MREAARQRRRHAWPHLVRAGRPGRHAQRVHVGREPVGLDDPPAHTCARSAIRARTACGPLSPHASLGRPSMQGRRAWGEAAVGKGPVVHARRGPPGAGNPGRAGAARIVHSLWQQRLALVNDLRLVLQQPQRLPLLDLRRRPAARRPHAATRFSRRFPALARRGRLVRHGAHPAGTARLASRATAVFRDAGRAGRRRRVEWGAACARMP